MQSPGAAVFMTVWVGMALGFGFWMLIFPKHYWKTWKSYLKHGDPFESSFPGRTGWLLAYIHRPNAIRRARILGAAFVSVGLGVGALVLSGLLPLK